MTSGYNTKGYENVSLSKLSLDHSDHDQSSISDLSYEYYKANSGVQAGSNNIPGYVALGPVDPQDKNSSHDDKYVANSLRTGRAWQPGFWVRFPILGILALFGTLVGRCLKKRISTYVPAQDLFR
jgi:hypothetical protein